MEPNNQTTQAAPVAPTPVQPITTPFIQPTAPPVTAAASTAPLVPSSMNKTGVTYAFATTLTVLAVLIGAVGMYYWDLQQQLASAQEQLSVPMPQRTAPAVPFSPAFLAPTSTQTLYKNMPFTVRWTPLRLKDGEAAQIWIGHAAGTMVQIGQPGDIKLDSGSYTLTIDDNLWRYVKPMVNGQASDMAMKIGHYEKTGAGVMQFIPETTLSASFFAGDSTSTATTTLKK